MSKPANEECSGKIIDILLDFRITTKYETEYPNVRIIERLFGYYLFKLLSLITYW